MKLGLVLAGGGGKGSYEIGVWRALRELGLEKHIAAVSGTSAGALNAMLFYHGDLELSEKVWGSLSPGALLPEEGTGDLEAGQKSLSGLMDLVLDLQHPDRDMLCCVAAKRVRDGAVRYFELSALDKEAQKQALLASSALPGLFPPVEIQGELFSDGGIEGDNVPIRPLHDRGIRTAVVVHLKPEGNPFGEWPDMDLIHVIPSSTLGGHEDGTLDFRPESAVWRREMGLQDGRKALADLARRLGTR